MQRIQIQVVECPSCKLTHSIRHEDEFYALPLSEEDKSNFKKIDCELEKIGIKVLYC